MHLLSSKWLTTLVLLTLIFGVRFLALKRLDSVAGMSNKERRRWAGTIRNAALFLLIVFLLYIWFEQLRIFATSLMVIGVAFVLATKEFFLNLTGFLFRSSTQFFKVGDRISIGDIRGDVIDQSPMGVTVMEISANHLYTGRAVFVPNLKFMNQYVKNESYFKDYVFHFITVPVKKDDNWGLARDALLDAAINISRSYINEAKKHLSLLSEKYKLDAPPVEPRVYVKLSKPEEIELILRVPVPAKRRGRINQEITKEYLELLTHAIEAKKNGNDAVSVPKG